MNIVEYAIKFKDMASGELGRFGNKSRQTFAKVSQYAEQLTGKNRTIGQSYDEIQRKIKQVENTIRTSNIPSQIKAARRELEALQRQSSSYMDGKALNSGSKGGLKGLVGATGLGTLARYAGAAAIGGAVLEVGSAMKGSIGAALERQQTQTAFNVLTGSEQTGGTLTSQLVNLQKDTILGGEVFKNAQTMLAFGADAREVASDLKMLGDIAMGDAERLGSLTLAFSQSRAAGKLTGQDLLQMVNAGFNPLQVMSEKSGKSIAQLRKEMEAGTITFPQLKQAFIDATSEGGKFNNMLETIAKTPAGKTAQLSGAWDEIKVKAGTAFMPLVNVLLDLGTKLTPIIESAITPLASGIQKGAEWMQNLTNETQGWGKWIAIIKDYFVNGLFPFIQKILGAIIHIVAKVIEWIGKFEILRDLFSGVYTILTLTLKGVGVLIDGLVWLFDKIVMPILNGINWAYKLIKGSKDVVASRNTLNSPTASFEITPTGGNVELVQQIAQNTAANATAAKNTEKAVTGGGPKTINITVQKFLDEININTTNLKDGVADIENRILEMFARVVVQGAKAQ